MIRGRACRAIILILPLYLTLALALPMVLLDHELGVLTGDPAHGALDDHAWLDHVAGSGLCESGHILEVGNLLLSPAFQVHPNPVTPFYRRSCLGRAPPLP